MLKLALKSTLIPKSKLVLKLYGNANVDADVKSNAKSNVKAVVKANAKSKVEMAIKVMVSLMTKLLLMVLPKIPSLNGDQSKGDSIMCADVIIKSPKFPRMSEHQQVQMGE